MTKNNKKLLTWRSNALTMRAFGTVGWVIEWVRASVICSTKARDGGSMFEEVDIFATGVGSILGLRK
jgi:hypothetical protein